MDGWMGEWADIRIDGWMDGWMDGRMDDGWIRQWVGIRYWTEGNEGVCEREEADLFVAGRTSC